jgi:CYTH domain-containing protein
MAKEIERKFLVREGIRESDIAEMSEGSKSIRQYYLVSSKDAAVRLRHQSGTADAILTVKAGGNGISTDEFEFPVAAAYYEGHIGDRQGIEIVKTRFLVPHGGRTWEVDVFRGDLEGLVVAELECDDAAEVTDLPEWASTEVTYDSRYKNAVLALMGKPTGTRGLRTLTLNPFAKNIITIEDPPTYLIDAIEQKPLNPSAPNAERQKAFEDAMSQSVRADPDEFMLSPWDSVTSVTGLRSTTINPFSAEAQHEGLTEGLLFAPGDAVFTEGKPIANEQTPEMVAGLRFAGALRESGNDAVAQMNLLADYVLTSFVAEDQAKAIDAVRYEKDAEHAAAQRLVEALRAADIDVVFMLDDLTECVESEFSGDDDASPAGTLSVVFTKEELDAALEKTSSGYIDQSQDLAANDDSFILVGEVTDEASLELMKRAAAEGHRPYPNKED